MLIKILKCKILSSENDQNSILLNIKNNFSNICKKALKRGKGPVFEIFWLLRTSVV